MILWMVFQSPVPAYVCAALGTSDWSGGSGLFAHMMSPGCLGADLEALQFVQVLAEGGVAVMIAVATAYNMSAVRLVMMHGVLRGVRLRQLTRVGPRDNRMRGNRAAAETRALGGRGVGRHSGKVQRATGEQLSDLHWASKGIGRGKEVPPQTGRAVEKATKSQESDARSVCAAPLEPVQVAKQPSAMSERC